MSNDEHLAGGRYRRDEPILQDASGTLYRGWDTYLQRPITIKVLASPHASPDPTSDDGGFSASGVRDARTQKRFEREARILGGLTHSSLVPVYQVDLVHTPPFMVLGCVEGRSLRSWIDEIGGASWTQVQSWMTALLQCISLAHARGFVHHDLNPDIFFVDPGTNGTQLLGFGRLQVIGHDPSTLEQRLETPVFWAPEMFVSEDVDVRSDLYGVAALAYFALTGSPPFDAALDEGLAPTLSRIMAGEIARPASVVGTVPADFDAWIMRGLALDPRERFQSASEMLVALSELGGGTLPIAEHPIAEPIRVGEVIDGKYRVRGRLGVGGTSMVFLARDVRKERDVALKSLRRSAGSQDSLMSEVGALRSLRHPNIVSVYDVGHFRGTPYMVLEHVPGRSVADELRRFGGPLPVWHALSIVDQVSRGVGVVHRAGLVHGDITPANVLIGPGMRVCVVDFGLVQDRGQYGQKPHRFAGTPAYTAPERVRSEILPELAERIDVYALAVMTYELLTGRRPFRDCPLNELLAAHVWTTPPAPSSWNASLQWADAPILAALNKDPSARTASCGLFASELLRSALRGLGGDRAVDVLVADADASFYEFTQRTLESWCPRATVVHAGNGVKALALIEQVQFDAVLMDLAVPGMNGFELAAQVRASVRTPPPIGCVTASGEKADWQLLAALGVEGFLRKPVREEELGAFVMRLLQLPQLNASPELSEGRVAVGG